MDRVLKFERATKSGNNNFTHLKKITNLFRAIELFVVLFLVSRFSFRLPEAVKTSGEYFNDMKAAVLSPWFVFVLGNVIVVALFAKSGREYSPKNDFYDEFVEKSERLSHSHVQPHVELPEYEDKEVIFEKVNVVSSEDVGNYSSCYGRSRSEKFGQGRDERPRNEVLRRSETEKCTKRFRCGEKLSIDGPFPEDSMSSDEFRRTIEAFIARQQKFLKGEEYYSD